MTTLTVILDSLVLLFVAFLGNLLFGTLPIALDEWLEKRKQSSNALHQEQ